MRPVGFFRPRNHVSIMIFLSFLSFIILPLVAFGHQGNSLILDGYFDYAWAPNCESLDISGNKLTMEAWVKLSGATGGPAGNHWILSKQDIEANRSYGFYIAGESRKIIPSIHASYHFEGEVGEAVLDYNTWYHVAVVYDGIRIITFVNGQFNGEAQVSGNLEHNAKELTIGGTYWAPLDSTNGSIDEVRLWNIARSQAEIEATMGQTLTGNEVGLLGYWQFDSMEDLGVANAGQNDFRDFSPNTNHADLRSTTYEYSWIDYNGDGDVDGSDLASYINNNPFGVNLTIFAKKFGSDETLVPPTVTYPHLDLLVTHIPDDPDNLTWHSYVSSEAARLPQQYIFLNVDGGADDYSKNVQVCKDAAQYYGTMATSSKYIIITIALYRGDGNYSVSFPASNFSESTEERFYRPDLKVNTILDTFINELNSAGLNVNRRVLLWGYSNQAMFAQRYTILHPDRVKAAAMGSPGQAVTLPFPNYNDTNISWPAGVYDYELLTGKAFGFAEYAAIPKYIFTGELDFSGTVYGDYGWNLDVFSLEQCQFMYNLSASDPERLRVQTDIMKAAGDNVTFYMYPNRGHEYGEEEWNVVMAFLEENSY